MFTRIPLRRVSLQSKRLNPTPARMVTASSSSSVSGGTVVPSVPRPSASLIVVNDKNEVLLVQRNSKSRSFAGAHVRLSFPLFPSPFRNNPLTVQVFPGGNHDEDDGESGHRMTAIRETFEETGLLLAKSRSTPVPPELDQETLSRGRQSILLGKTRFSEFLEGAGVTAAVDELLPFTEWITPVQVPRYDSSSWFRCMR